MPEIEFTEFSIIMPRKMLDPEKKYLQADVTENEIIEALSAIPDDKASGNDGFSYFFEVT